MTRYQSTQAIVIRRQAYHDSDIIYTFLTPFLGKISAIAKNVRQIKSSRSGALQLGNIAKIQLYTINGRNWLSEAKTEISFLGKEKNLTQHLLLFYILEIINLTIAENQSTPLIYPITRLLINSINENNFSDVIKSEIELVEQLGFGVPEEILKSFQLKEYIKCQLYLKKFLETVTERPLQSLKLFK